jgi:hypothetical protein
LATLTRERVERIARSHACVICREYSYKKVIVKRASAAHKAELNVRWHAVATCGVCSTENEIGIDDEGHIVYAG